VGEGGYTLPLNQWGSARGQVFAVAKAGNGVQVLIRCVCRDG
jgi:hypothetical protein